MKKEIICTVAGTLGSLIASFFGGWSALMMALIVLMTADYLTGLVVAAVFHKSNKSANGKLESKAGWKGLCRKCMTLLLVLVAHHLDLALGVNYIRNAVIIGFLANELISLLENAALMGVTSPTLNKAIDILTDREKKENEHDEN